MSDELAALDQAFEALVKMEADMEAFLKDGNEADICLKDGSPYTIRDAVVGLRTLISRLAGALVARSTKSQVEGIVEKALTEKIPEVTQAAPPEGSLIVSGDDMDKATVLVLHKATRELLSQLVRLAAAKLAGGTDDVLALVEKYGTPRRDDYYGKPRAYAGYPYVGSCVVQRAGALGLRKAAGGPEEDKSGLEDLGSYLLRAAQTKRNAVVRLVGENDPRATKVEE
jgi:hypothetical protein